jgi:hypothetical protein
MGNKIRFTIGLFVSLFLFLAVPSYSDETGDGAVIGGSSGSATAEAEAYDSGWDSDDGAAQKNDIYDYLHSFDSDDDKSFIDETWFTALSGAHVFTDQAESGFSAEVVVTANGKSLITAANYAAMKTLMDLESGTDFNAYDADLTTWAGITPGANVGTALAIAVGTAGAFLPNNASGAALTGIPLDSDFASNGVMTRTAEGTYSVVALDSDGTHFLDGAGAFSALADGDIPNDITIATTTDMNILNTTPAIIFSDTGGADSQIDGNAVDANDGTLLLKTEIDTSMTTFIDIRGDTETIDAKYPITVPNGGGLRTKATDAGQTSIIWVYNNTLNQWDPAFTFTSGIDGARKVSLGAGVGFDGLGDWNIGHVSDTTLARVSAGVLSIEGVNIVTTSSTDTLTNKTITTPAVTNASVDGHAALSPMTVAQVSGTVIYNTGQIVGDVNNTLPQAAAGYSFIGYVGTTLAATNYWRFTADASPQDYMCLDGTCGKLYVSVDTPTMGDCVTCWTGQVSSTGIKTGAALAMGSTKDLVANGAFEFDALGTGYAEGAEAAGTAPGDDVIPEDKYGAVALDIGANGTIDVIEASANATGYDSAALAIAGIAAAEAGHARMGTVTVMKDNGAFTFGTTEFDDANTTEVFTSATAYTPPYNWICVSGKGTWTTD